MNDHSREDLIHERRCHDVWEEVIAPSVSARIAQGSDHRNKSDGTGVGQPYLDMKRVFLVEGNFLQRSDGTTRKMGFANLFECKCHHWYELGPESY